MVQSAARTVDEYLAELTDERRRTISALRDVLRENLPSGYQEGVNWGMIAYEVPLERYPHTYNKQPLMYAALAAQKNHYAIYLTCVYQDEAKMAELKAAFAKAGKKLDMGKACLRFKKLEDVPLDVIGEVVGGTSVEEFLARYEEVQRKRKSSS